MANFYRSYIDKVDSFLEGEHLDTEVNEMINEHLTKIGFFQHERWLHFCATMLFAVLDIVMLVVYFFTSDCFVALLVFMFTALLIPYVFHYYFLENSVQKMYGQYDLLKKMLK